MNCIQAQSANDVWRQAHKLLRPEIAAGRVRQSRAGNTYELLHVAIEIRDPRERWVVSRKPPINPAFAIAEVIWILAGSNEAAVLNYWFPRLPQFSGEVSAYAGAYGHRLRRHFGLDQVKRACEALAANPDSRQVVLQLWDVNTDLPDSLGKPRNQDVPCNIVSLLKVRNGSLEWTQVMRSNDLYRGLPYNLVQFTTLQELMAGWLKLELGSYHHWSDSLHIYASDNDTFVSMDTSGAPNTDRLATTMADGEALIARLFGRLQSLTRPTLTEKDIEELAQLEDAPSAYKNLVIVLAAESARRRGFFALSSSIASSCTNAQLSEVWSRWSIWTSPAKRKLAQ